MSFSVVKTGWLLLILGLVFLVLFHPISQQLLRGSLSDSQALEALVTSIPNDTLSYAPQFSFVDTRIFHTFSGTLAEFPCVSHYVNAFSDNKYLQYLSIGLTTCSLEEFESQIRARPLGDAEVRYFSLEVDSQPLFVEAIQEDTRENYWTTQIYYFVEGKLIRANAQGVALDKIPQFAIASYRAFVAAPKLRLEFVGLGKRIWVDSAIDRVVSDWRILMPESTLLFAITFTNNGNSWDSNPNNSKGTWAIEGGDSGYKSYRITLNASSSHNVCYWSTHWYGNDPEPAVDNCTMWQ